MILHVGKQGEFRPNLYSRYQNISISDSPHLKVKPFSKRAGAGCVQLGVECYGGGLVVINSFLFFLSCFYKRYLMFLLLCIFRLVLNIIHEKFVAYLVRP